MSKNYLLSDIVESVRMRYDLPTFSAYTFVTQTLVESFIQESVLDIQSLLMDAYGSDYFLTWGSISATANTATTSLPSGCIKIRKLQWARGTDDFVDIKPARPEDLELAYHSATTWTNPKYQLTSNAIHWLPIPSQTYSCRIWYTYTQPTINSSTVPWTAESSWAEWVILDVCRKICEREDLDPSKWQAERARVENRIKLQAPDREDSTPAQLRDTWGGGTSRLDAWTLRDILTRGDY